MQVQLQGPLPETSGVEPSLQRLLVGLLVTLVPPVAPQLPFTGAGTDAKLAEHEALAPPFDPLQVQLQGPLPDTSGVEPSPQRFAVGAIKSVRPWAEPQTPSTGMAVVWLKVATTIWLVAIL
ncbi:MAG: hypothetical protein CVU24_18670 [Betaproteobacteria bacterium HGW-Betaproteobacteria-18]|nr:MAG: hypothetical protein CVU24_18670 [Betaproteobacteria bacterium HGW-Betaproteobacteria-18]